MAAADVEIVHQPAVLDVEAVAGRSIAMGDQRALRATVGNFHMGFDRVASAADIGQGREAAKTRSIAIGFQIVLGTLFNAILNDPGPLSIPIGRWRCGSGIVCCCCCRPR